MQWLLPMAAAAIAHLAAGEIATVEEQGSCDAERGEALLLLQTQQRVRGRQPSMPPPWWPQDNTTESNRTFVDLLESQLGGLHAFTHNVSGVVAILTDTLEEGITNAAGSAMGVLHPGMNTTLSALHQQVQVLRNFTTVIMQNLEDMMHDPVHVGPVDQLHAFEGLMVANILGFLQDFVGIEFWWQALADDVVGYVNSTSPSTGELPHQQAAFEVKDRFDRAYNLAGEFESFVVRALYAVDGVGHLSPDVALEEVRVMTGALADGTAMVPDLLEAVRSAFEMIT